jgi:predicted nuclease of predicted toxin-antitoxin system
MLADRPRTRRLLHDPLDAQLPPALAAWIAVTFGIPTQAVRDLGLTGAKDPEISKPLATRKPL